MCARYPSSSAIDVFCILFVDLVAMPEVPHPIPFRTRSLSPPGPMVLRLKARESRSSPGLQRGCLPFNDPSSRSYSPVAAGWSSPVARQAHNLKVTGSNPVPAPKAPKDLTPRRGRRPRTYLSKRPRRNAGLFSFRPQSLLPEWSACRSIFAKGA